VPSILWSVDNAKTCKIGLYLAILEPPRTGVSQGMRDATVKMELSAKLAEVSATLLAYAGRTQKFMICITAKLV
jgi:hypothetical protein